MRNNIQCDIALIHPPHIFIQNDYPIFPLPWNLGHIGNPSFIGKYPISPSWNVEPLGFETIRNFIKKNSSYSIEIINLSLLRPMIFEYLSKKNVQVNKKDKSLLNDYAERFSPDIILSTLKSIKADVFAVDLHWLNYSHGAIKILESIKRIHPDSHTVIGGLTASYYAKEIMDAFSFIDFLISGDGCFPLLRLIEQINGKKQFSKVPNLLYREGGKLLFGPKRNLNDFEIVQDDVDSFTSIPTGRGCPLQCITCGGSKYSSKRAFNYTKFNAYQIDSILEKLFKAHKKFKSYKKHEIPNLFLIHDPFFTLGKKYWEILLNEINKQQLQISFLIEFFAPHSEEDILKIAKNVPGSAIHFSPESIDEKVRSFHKNLKYSNDKLIMNMNLINEIDSLSLQVWFMAGLAKDNHISISKTLTFIKEFYEKINDNEKTILKYNELLFLDPGSLAYDFPDKYGYKLIYNSFIEYFEAFAMPIFKYQLNYCTHIYNIHQLFSLFLDIHNKMNEIYYEKAVIDKQLFNRATIFNNLLLKYSPRYDNALLMKTIKSRNKLFNKIGMQFRADLEK